MHYQTVFEIGFKSFPWNAVLHPVPFILVGAFLFRFGRNKQIYRFVGIIVASLATLFFVVATVNFLPQFVALRNAYRDGDSSVVEGVVEDFRAAPALGAARESFSVRGVVFSYNALDATSCFHNAPLHRALSSLASTSGFTIKANAFNEWKSDGRIEVGQLLINAVTGQVEGDGGRTENPSCYRDAISYSGARLSWSPLADRGHE
jgi:hypothetical protein